MTPQSTLAPPTKPRQARAQHFQLQSLCEILDNYVPFVLDSTCTLPGLEVSGFVLPHDGHRGGDFALPLVHASTTDYKLVTMDPAMDPIKRNSILVPLKEGKKSHIDLLIADPAGHGLVDGVSAGMLYQAARVAIAYEMKIHGEVTPNLTRFLVDAFYPGQPSSLPITALFARVAVDKTASGEEIARLSYQSFGHPHPLILRAGKTTFDSYPITDENTSAPIGLLPADSPINTFYINRTKLKTGDIALLFSDGLEDNGKAHRSNFFPHEVARTVCENREKSAYEIRQAVKESALLNALDRGDDITCFVVKKTDYKPAEGLAAS